MNCVYINSLPTTKEYFYKNESSEGEVLNVHVCNTSNSAVTVTIAIGTSINTTGYSIIEESMNAGARITLTDIAVNSGMFLYGTAGTANKITLKVDKQ